MLQRHLGATGAALQDLGRGEDRRSVMPDRARKSYGEERTFERDLHDGDEIRRVIAAQAESLAHRLRKAGRTARTVTLKLKLTRALTPGKYPVLTRSATLPAASDDGKRIGDAALDLWRSSHEGRSVRLIGVSVSRIDEPSTPQLPLFEAPSRRRDAPLNQAIDQLADRFGTGIVKRGPPE
jgi:DNA polymerase-4